MTSESHIFALPSESTALTMSTPKPAAATYPDLQPDASSTKTKQKRRAISDAERKLLRDYYYQKKGGAIKHKDVIKWYAETHCRTFNQSTISESLGSNFAHLDNQPKTTHPQRKRLRESWFPDLEHALFEWQQTQQEQNKTITGEILLEKASRLWTLLPQYRNEHEPKWSAGWLQGFKSRHNTREYQRFGESSSVDQDAVEMEWHKLRDELQEKDSNDIYNMNETALFWKATPDGTSERISGTQTHKARITANFCCNATGRHKLPPWFIGTANEPRCFSRSGVNVANLAMVWKSNSNGWMTGRLFKEWLQWFDSQMYGRSVILLVDSVLAHKIGIDLFSKEIGGGLLHTTVIFLPNDSTAFCQPLDQGIIRAWKAHYRRRWLQYVCDRMDVRENPYKQMHVLQAIRWGIAAWDEISAKTINACWAKSRVLSAKYGSETREEAESRGWDEEMHTQKRKEDKIQAMIQRLAQQNRIKSVMPVEKFLNPEDEMITDSAENALVSIAEGYAVTDHERDHESDEEEVVEPRIQDSEALQLLRRLRLYEEQQENGDADLLLQLNRHEVVVQDRLLASNRKWTNIMSSFGAKDG